MTGNGNDAMIFGTPCDHGLVLRRGLSENRNLPMVKIGETTFRTGIEADTEERVTFGG